MLVRNLGNLHAAAKGPDGIRRREGNFTAVPRAGEGARDAIGTSQFGQPYLPWHRVSHPALEGTLGCPDTPAGFPSAVPRRRKTPTNGVSWLVAKSGKLFRLNLSLAEQR